MTERTGFVQRRRPVGILAVHIRSIVQRDVGRENLFHDVQIALFTRSMQRIGRTQTSCRDRRRLSLNEITGENTRQTIGFLLVVLNDAFDAGDLRTRVYKQQRTVKTKFAPSHTDREVDVINELYFVMITFLATNQREAEIVNGRGAIAQEKQAVASVANVFRSQ